jgi:glyoxylase-like metal-dependent hydrolase (beta-lactamase superfamily II)
MLSSGTRPGVHTRTRLVVACLAIGITPALPAAAPRPSDAMPVEIEWVSDRVLVARCPVGSNVTAITTSRGVVIVDTHLSPGSMRAIRARIEEVTGQREFPYVINTHGDWDHCSGNQVFPGATILGHASSPMFMRHHRANPFGTMWQEESVLSEDRKSLESATEPGKVAELRARIATRQLILSSLETEYVPTPPNATFEDRYDLDVGDVPVQLIYCGAAHTITDIFVYLPGERVVVAGDVFCPPASICFRVGPLADVPTLLEAVDHVLGRGVDVVIPGHGRPMSGDDLRGLRDRLANDFAGQSGVVSAAQTLKRTLEVNGIAAARRLFGEVPPDISSVGYLSEDEFYILGNRFMDQSKPEAAAVVFDLAENCFPKSSLIFGGLGRMHLFNGDTLLAISAYQRAYDLAPNNRMAEAMLRRLRGREE